MISHADDDGNDKGDNDKNGDNNAHNKPPTFISCL